MHDEIPNYTNVNEPTDELNNAGRGFTTPKTSRGVVKPRATFVESVRTSGAVSETI